MRAIYKPIAKFIFFLLAAALLYWTATLTLSFLEMALPNLEIARYFGLIVFDVGAVSWLFVFINGAEGIGQRVAALVAALFDLFGIGLMVTAEIILDGQTLVQAPEDLARAAVYGLAAWTFINVCLVFAFHILEPEVLKDIAVKNAKGKIEAKALQELERRTDQIADSVADQLAVRYVEDTLQALSIDKKELSGGAQNFPTMRAAGSVSEKERVKVGINGSFPE